MCEIFHNKLRGENPVKITKKKRKEVFLTSIKQGNKYNHKVWNMIESVVQKDKFSEEELIQKNKYQDIPSWNC